MIWIKVINGIKYIPVYQNIMVMCKLVMHTFHNALTLAPCRTSSCIDVGCPAMAASCRDGYIICIIIDIIISLNYAQLNILQSTHHLQSLSDLWKIIVKNNCISLLNWYLLVSIPTPVCWSHIPCLLWLFWRDKFDEASCAYSV